MTNNIFQVKSQILEDIENNWKSLDKYLSKLSETQLTSVHDESGWTIKDHLSHLEAWENSVVYYLLRKPRYEGLGIEETIFNNGTIDEINEQIHRSCMEKSYTQIRNRLNKTHNELLSLIKQLTDAELSQSLNSYHPEAIDNDNRKVVDIIRDNSSSHFVEHLGWIKSIDIV